MSTLTRRELGELGSSLADATVRARDELVGAVVGDLEFPLRDVKREYERTVGALRRLADLEHHIADRDPIAGPHGQLALLLPFNMGPFALFVIAAIAGAGNHVLVRLSTRAPALAQAMARVLRDSSLPRTVSFSSQGGHDFVTAAIGSDDVPALIAYGGEQLGAQLLGQPLGTRIIFEGPGKDPMLVGSGCDAGEVATLLRQTKFSRSGQECTSTERLVLPTGADETVDAVVEMVQSLQVSPTWDAAADVTSLISDRAAVGIRHQLQEAQELGATVAVGGRVLDRFVEPTVVVDVPREASLWQEETFGPVLAVRQEDSIDDMLRVATEGRYGLHGIVVGMPEVTARLVGEPYAVPVPHLRHGSVGTVSIDRPPLTDPADDVAPFGGWGISGWIRDADGQLRQGPRVLAREVTL